MIRRIACCALALLAAHARLCAAGTSAAEPTTATKQAEHLQNLMTALDQAPPAGLPGTMETTASQPSSLVPPNMGAPLAEGTTTSLKLIVHRPEEGVDLALLNTTTTGTRPMLHGTSHTLGGSRRTSATLVLPGGAELPRTTPTLPALTPTMTPRPSLMQLAPGARPRATPAPPRQVRLNFEDEKQLSEGLHIDARRARMIIEFRKLYGAYHSPDDLNQVTGIPDDAVRKWEQDGILKFD